MGATYINGNTFKVGYTLWRRDIESYFRHTYFSHPAAVIFRTKTIRFAHSMLFTGLLTIAVFAVSYFVGLQDQPFIFLHAPVMLVMIAWARYRHTLEKKSPVLDKQLMFCLDRNRITIRNQTLKSIIEIRPRDIISIAEKPDMIILYTQEDEYVIPTRALTQGQIESLRTFAS